MFTIDCPQHGSRVLVTESRIRTLRNTEGRILVDVECWCGTRVTIRTGRRTSRVGDRAPAREANLAHRTAGPGPTRNPNLTQGSNL